MPSGRQVGFGFGPVFPEPVMRIAFHWRIMMLYGWSRIPGEPDADGTLGVVFLVEIKVWS